MGLGRYVTNFGIISSLLAALGVRKQTKEMPQDWRRLAVWAGWAISLALAITSVRKAEDDKAFIEAQKEADKREAEIAKAEKKAKKR